MKISILETGPKSAQQNMEKDAQLLKDLSPNDLPLLHLYEWSHDSLTYGYFADPKKLLDEEGLKKHDIDQARRCTGGGVTLHFTDLAFSFFMPADHEHFSENTFKNYQFVADVLKRAIHPYLKEEKLEDYRPDKKEGRDETRFFCMAKPTRYDVMVKGRKIGGAAQRQTKKGYLHHGTIAIARPDEQVLRDILKNKEDVYASILNYGYYFVENHLEREKVDAYRKKIRESLIKSFQAV